MWGINIPVIAKILGGAMLKEFFSSNHGAPKIIRNKITGYAADKEIASAKALARLVAVQDYHLYNDLKQQLRNKLSEEEWQQIFSD
ncbi:MAG TPA: hypothetical protein QF626_08105 [Prochlorococcaceae cyanobacterium Fu_MAG_50]|nr:hypothetical protein [Prochlorococcaceae cyanobacterium Fu_MAG_50]